jgi:two-component system, OmpR family, sensor histidine kinase KdpD
MENTGAARKGTLKIYLGYAAGVGKTYQMLEDAQELRRQGNDIVIGYFEPHGRQDTIAKTEGMEIIPRRRISYRGTFFEEMDTEAILRRKPAICLVDELAHTNVPGSERGKRWQDVSILLDAGITVLSTVNVQHLESLNDQIWQLTGVHVRETLPDYVVDEADQVVLVDLTPEALRNRIIRGAVYPEDKAQKALEHFFKEQNLSALREIALRHAAHEVERPMLDSSKPQRLYSDQEIAHREECILVCIDEKPSTAMLIRRAQRVADYLKGTCLAIYVLPDLNWEKIPAQQREAVEQHLSFARNLRVETHVIEGEDIAETIVGFARTHTVTQIFMGRSDTKYLPGFKRNNKIHRLVRLARDMQVTLVAERRRHQ